MRRSGLYREVGGHVNSYQLFLERMLQLVRPAGRIGCLLPGGMLVDHGAAALRRHLLDRASVDHLSIFDNRDALFPIHRSVRIVAMTGTSGGPTEAMLVDDGVLATTEGRTQGAPDAPRLLPRSLLREGSGDLEAVPWVRDGDEVRLLEQLLSFPRLGGAHWHLRFGRELNATEDKALLRSGPVPDGGLAVVDGKHLQAFSVCPPDTASWISVDGRVTRTPRPEVATVATRLPRRVVCDEHAIADRRAAAPGVRQHAHALLPAHAARTTHAAVPVRHVEQPGGGLVRPALSGRPCHHQPDREPAGPEGGGDTSAAAAPRAAHREADARP